MTVKSSNCLSKWRVSSKTVFSSSRLLLFRARSRKLPGHDRGADRDGRNQECAAEDKPVDRIGAGGMSDAQRCGTVCRHGSRSLPRLKTPEADFLRPGPAHEYADGMEMTLGT